MWGAKVPRRFFSDAHWSEPLRWNREAGKEKKRRRVFCASMADVFERRRELKPWREKLWMLIEQTSWLDWLLLTKRPSLIGRYTPWQDEWPRNVWLGTTAESQKWADQRIPRLVEHPAAIKFLSCEPLLGPLNLGPWLDKLDWVIAGGESGAHARPMNPQWVRDLRDQCIAAGIAFHFKQWGHWRPDPFTSYGQRRVIRLVDASAGVLEMVALGKKAAGRDLDGQFWDGFPTPTPNVSVS